MFLRTFIVVLLSGTITLPILAQEKAKLRADDFVRAQRESAARNPEGVALTIEFAGGQRKFSQGEVMTLVLNFSSSRPGVYRLNPNTRDRSLRMDTDDFHLDSRDGVADPLEGALIMSLGGLYAFPKGLDNASQQINHDLNEWMRFDRPGRYRLYVTSPRVSTVNRRRGGSNDPISITSNLIEFVVVPADRVWQRQQLGRAVSLLDGRGPGSEDQQGCRILHYLGTREAAIELIRRVGNPQEECQGQYRLGLRGSPHLETGAVSEGCEIRLATVQ